MPDDSCQIKNVEDMAIRWRDDGEDGDYFYHSTRLFQHPTPLEPALLTSATFYDNCRVASHTLKDLSVVVADLLATEGGRKALVFQLGVPATSHPMVTA